MMCVAGSPSIPNPRPALPARGQSEKCYGGIRVQLAPSPSLLFQQLEVEPLLRGGHCACSGGIMIARWMILSPHSEPTNIRT